MMDMLVITLREGIEAFLIVAIAAAYLRKTGRAALLPALWAGTAAALALSAVVGGWLIEVAVQPLYEGLLAAVAAVLVISMAIYMNGAGRRMGAEIGARIDAAATDSGRGAWLGVFLFTLVMIAREGVETAFMIAALARNEGTEAMLAGALAGTVLAALLAYGWLRWGRRVNLALFFQATSIFLILFSLQLLLYAFHEFTEAEALPLDNSWWHVATEEWAEGSYARIYSALMVLLPLAWAASVTLRKRMS